MAGWIDGWIDVLLHTIRKACKDVSRVPSESICRNIYLHRFDVNRTSGRSE